MVGLSQISLKHQPISIDHLKLPSYTGRIQSTDGLIYMLVSLALSMALTTWWLLRPILND